MVSTYSHETFLRARGLLTCFPSGTIRNAYKQLYNNREKLIRPQWLENGAGDINALPTA